VSKTAVIIVDVQHDFLPGGALGVDGGNEILDGIVREAQKADVIVTTQDWHPADNKRHWEKWPVHCVQGTPGADLHPAIKAIPVSLRIHKGLSHEDDGYSGYTAFLPTFLRQTGVEKLVVCGLALDYCVGATAQDAADDGWDVTVPLDLTRPVAADTGNEMVKTLTLSGVNVIPPEARRP
jgi:nicotinamidase/pyrazinamidase